jgi:hypothetical protein
MIPIMTLKKTMSMSPTARPPGSTVPGGYGVLVPGMVALTGGMPLATNCAPYLRANKTTDERTEKEKHRERETEKRVVYKEKETEMCCLHQYEKSKRKSNKEIEIKMFCLHPTTTTGEEKHRRVIYINVRRKRETQMCYFHPNK